MVGTIIVAVVTVAALVGLGYELWNLYKEWEW